MRLPAGGLLLDKPAVEDVALFVYLIPIADSESFSAFVGWSSKSPRTEINGPFDWPTPTGEEKHRESYATNVFHLFDKSGRRLNERFPRIDEWQLIPTRQTAVENSDKGFNELLNASLEAQLKAQVVDPDTDAGARTCASACERAWTDIKEVAIPYLEQNLQH